MGLLDGGLASIFSAAFGGVYRSATLHRRAAYAADDGGTIADSGWTEESVLAHFDMVTEGMRRAEGFTDADVRILVLAANVDPITTSCEITLSGIRWSIASVGQDPAATYYDLHGQMA